MTTSEETRELRALEDALDAGAVNAADPGERSVQELALLLREIHAIEPERDFKLKLDARVGASFPRQGRLGSLRDRVRLPRLTSPAFAGAAASVVLALVVTVALVGGGDDASSPATTAPSAGSGGGGSSIQPETAPAQKADEAARSAAPSELAAPTQDSVIVPPEPPVDNQRIAPGEQRQVERSAALTLGSPQDEIQDVADRIVQVVGRNRGFVLSSNVTSGEEGFSGGAFDLRIPARRLQETIRELSELGNVKALSQSGQDVTAAVTSTSEALERARADRRGLLRRLENAKTEDERQAVRRRLRLVQSEINGLRGRLNSQRERVNYAQVAVTLVPDEKGAADKNNAFDDFLNTLQDSGELALRVAGVLIPIALLTALFWFAGSRWQRRRRESALG